MLMLKIQIIIWITSQDPYVFEMWIMRAQSFTLSVCPCGKRVHDWGRNIGVEGPIKSYCRGCHWYNKATSHLWYFPLVFDVIYLSHPQAV
jgi:hypothetical protein